MFAKPQQKIAQVLRSLSLKARSILTTVIKMQFADICSNVISKTPFAKMEETKESLVKIEAKRSEVIFLFLC